MGEPPQADRVLQFRVRGMDCAEEVAALTRELTPLTGGEERLSFDLLNGRLTVWIDGPADLAARQIQKAVARAGLRAEPWVESAPEEATWRRHARAVVATSSGAFVLLGFLMQALGERGLEEILGPEVPGHGHALPPLARLAYALGVVAGLWLVLPRAWLAARRLRPDMNLLMTVAVLGAIAIGEWFEAATVSFLFAVSLALETWSVGRARRAVQSLIDLSPQMVHRLREDGTTDDAPPDAIAPGEQFLVKPGERIPLDGRVVTGASEANQAPITGESAPVGKGPGSEVFAGTINGDGSLVIEATKAARDTTLARIIRMVGEAHAQRAPVEQWVDRFARIYTPAVMALSLLVFAIPPLLFGASLYEWTYRALVLLVIACPCALVISTPVSIVAGLTSAARQGVLIKGGVYLEAPARVRAIAFDKTGTLTEGAPRVVEVAALDGHTAEEVLERAAAMEVHSDHPLARAVVGEAQRRGLRLGSVQDFQIDKGKGATARLAGRAYWLGSHRYLEERNQETPEVHARLETMSRGGRSVVVVGNERHVCGLIALADRTREEAASTIAGLRRLEIEHLIMLTGDNASTAAAIGAEAGVDEVWSELLPQDKVAKVDELLSRFQSVAMVGDGVNDAPAMARASFGIAMGAAGSDAAIETADIALMADDLSRLPWLIRHSRRTLRIIRQNIGISLGVKALFIGLTFAGAASLWGAIAADMGASIAVIFNGLRLMRAKRAAAFARIASASSGAPPVAETTS